MKSKKKQNIVRVLFLLVLFFVGNYYMANPINSKVNHEINSYTLTNKDILRPSGHWNLAPFVIDDLAPNYNWSKTSAENDWCSGSGTLEDPYLIENVTIDGENSGYCITIRNSDKYFRIENCTVFNSGDYSAGIRLDHAGNGTLINNNCSFNNIGILLYFSDNNTVSGNTANNNSDYGIYDLYSNNNTISGNTANNNQNRGIRLYYSNNTIVSGNTANHNSYGIEIYYSDNTTVSGNTANDNNDRGICLSDSDNTTVSGNTANNNDDGICLYYSVNTTVSGNVVDNNGIYGIYTSGSNYNLIYKNYFINNGIHALDEGSFNNWNSSIIGNYWDNYTGYDDDFDGIGDTPHNFGTGIDNLPIWNFQSPIHIDDSPASPIDWAWAETQPWCSGSGTFSDPYVIDGLNITARGVGNGIMIENSYKYFIVRNCKLIESGSGAYDAGIRLDLAGNGTLINNNCSFNNENGIFLYYSDNTTVSGNTANNNQDHGIYVRGSDNTTVSGNTANNNQNLGIYVRGSDNNTVSENSFNNNQHCGIYIYHSDKNTVSGNTANYNSIYGIQIYNSNNNTVSGNTANNNEGSGICIYGSYNTTVSGNTVNNYQDNGISLYYSDNTTVSENTANNNQDYGICIYRSNSTTVSGNVVDNNWIYGIYILESDYNLIYKNYFINNGIHALDEGNFNNWNSSIIGNYWDNYTGIDADKNSIGDTPHVFNGGTDYLPIYDVQAPLITIYYPINGTYWSYRKNIKIEATDTNLDSIWYEVNGQRVFISSGVTVLFDNEIWLGLPEGAFIIEIYANDTFGHLNDTYSLLLYKDTTPPIPTIYSPIQDQGFGSDAPTFNIAITELNLDTMWYVIVSDGTTKHIITSMIGSIDGSVWNSLADGTIAIKFYANDTAGNEAYSEVSIVKFTDPDPAPAPAPGIPGFNVIIALSVTFLVSVVIITRKKKLLNLN